MDKLKKYIKKLGFIVILLSSINLFSQGAGCNTAEPFCTGTMATFPAGVNNGTAAAGNDYGCLGSQPNPAWYYLQIDQPGNLTIDMSSNPAVDIDFALWGPFPDYSTAMVNCGILGPPTDCSYSTAPTETATITGANTGDVYILLITNFSNSATDISFTNTSGLATTNCSILIPCNISSLTTNPTACNPATNTYGVSGSIIFTDQPTTGTLTVTDCHGNNQVFNAPFTSPINYNITGINSDGVPCDITAVFSSNTSCNFTTNYTSPIACGCNVSIPYTPTNPTCNGYNNGQIVLAPQGGSAPYSYQWDAAAGNQITNPAINLGAGTYTVTVTDALFCQTDSTFTLTEPTPFTYTTNSQNSNCGLPDGWISVNFAGGTPIYTYDWGSGPTSNNTLLNLTPNTYTVTVADANGCDTTFNIIVGNNPAFTASITSFTDALCNGSLDGTSTANGSDPLATYSYSWNTIPIQTTQTATGLVIGTYICTVTDINSGCIDTTSVIIGEPTLLTVNTGLDITICDGGNTNISATGLGGTPIYTYNWDNGSILQTQNVSPLIQTTYIVTITDNNNCTSTDTVVIDVSPPLIVFADTDIYICPGDQANISATATPGSGNGGPYTYSWNNGVGFGQNHSVSPINTTNYVVTLTDGCSTPTTDTITVFINPVPQVNFISDTLSLCERPVGVFTLYNTTLMAGTTTWNFGDGTTGNGDTITHTYNGSGVYDISLTVTTSLGCVSELIKPGYVQVFENPIANFTIDLNPTSMFDPTIHLYDQSYNNIIFWNWDISGLDTSILSNPTYTFPEDTGEYMITLTVIDDNGCQDTISKSVIVKGEYGIYMPNSFTPNNDNMNEIFTPKGFGISSKDYSFFIFDRWGEIIFETHDNERGWDGTYKGKIIENDSYVWKIIFTDINNRKHTKYGYVNIIK